MIVKQFHTTVSKVRQRRKELGVFLGCTSDPLDTLSVPELLQLQIAICKEVELRFIDKEERIVRDKTNDEFQEMVSSFEINQTCPLYGTKVPFAGGEVGKMEESILDSYGLTKADFEVPKMPRLGSHGLRRAMIFQVWDASAVATDDGVMCEFSIDKGSYATAVLREVMKKDVY